MLHGGSGSPGVHLAATLAAAIHTVTPGNLAGRVGASARLTPLGTVGATTGAQRQLTQFRRGPPWRALLL
eukprot:scaffold21568_cov79-Isochrysis_galbana.AAC.4